MPDITAIAQALGALKAMKDIAEATIGLRDAAAFRERQIEFQGKIIDAQNALSALQEERTTLIETIRRRDEEIARVKAWETEKQRYELKDIAMGSGAFTYMIKPDAQRGEPLHCLCAYCYEKGNKRIMQMTVRTSGARHVWTCPECKNDIILVWWPPYGYPGSRAPKPASAPPN